MNWPHRAGTDEGTCPNGSTVKCKVTAWDFNPGLPPKSVNGLGKWQVNWECIFIKPNLKCVVCNDYGGRGTHRHIRILLLVFKIEVAAIVLHL